MKRFRRLRLTIAGTAAVVLAATGVAAAADHTASNDWPYAQGSQHGAERSVTLAAVGDIACEPNRAVNAGNPAVLKCGSPDLGGYRAAYATAGQAVAMQPAAVALLGDEQYQVGKLSDFENSFERTWGGLRMLERPAPGNHEYYAYTKHDDNEPAQNGLGYFSYFNGHNRAGAPYQQGQAGDYTSARQGWYSYDVGGWHIISLNVECDSQPFGHDCSTSDGGLLAQETHWLAADLHSAHARCTLAYWHQPTFSATTTAADAPNPAAPGVGSAEGAAADAWWKLLYQAHASLILNGHEHVYARMRPVDPNGNYDPKRGIRQITVGTGGEDLDTLATEGTAYSNPNVVTALDQAFGVLQLKLHESGYSWGFKPVLAGPGFPRSSLSYSDSGSGSCNGHEPDTSSR